MFTIWKCRIAAVIALFIVFSLWASPPPTVKAAGIVVNSIADTSPAGDGVCTLREAINNANADADITSGDCTAGAGTDTITFNLSGTILLTIPLPQIITAVIIDGSGQTIVLDGNASFSVLHVANTGSLTIESLTVQNGRAMFGGGIFNNGSELSIINSTISNNHTTTAGTGGGVYNNGGAITITNSIISGNTADNGGGGVYSQGDATIDNSLFINNTAPNASGALVLTTNFGDIAAVTNSSFVNNSTGGTGGAIRTGGNGAAFITNSTFSGNTANDGGAIYNFVGTLTVTQSTFAGNTAATGGAISSPSITLHLAGNLLASPVGGNCAITATLNDNGYNLANDNSCAFSGIGSINAANLPLGALSGGVHMPIIGSQALDAIPNGTLINNNGAPLACDGSTTDQLGNLRPIIAGEACNSGAVEGDGLPVPPDDPTVVPALQVPNVGEIMISLAQTQPAYVSAGGEPIYIGNSSPLLLPHDYDGNGFDTYVVTETQSVNGTLWFGIFIGNETWVWVPATNVTILR